LRYVGVERVAGFFLGPGVIGLLAALEVFPKLAAWREHDPKGDRPFPEQRCESWLIAGNAADSHDAGPSCLSNLSGLVFG
jgi:hypothetical protein